MVSSYDILGESLIHGTGNAERHDLLEHPDDRAGGVGLRRGELRRPHSSPRTASRSCGNPSLENGGLSHIPSAGCSACRSGRAAAPSRAFLDDLGAAGAGVLAIDGKTLRRAA